MSISAVRPASDLLRRVVCLQMLTIFWMSIEAVVALVAAWTARSPAFLGFGGDSAIELFSAIIVLWRFRSKPDSTIAEKLAARVAGGCSSLSPSSSSSALDCLSSDIANPNQASPNARNMHWFDL
jgi:hypothetical protein